MNTTTTGAIPFEKIDAELVARYFNISFGHALMYGITHQMTVDSLKPLYAVLKKTLDRVPLITVSVERESIFIEGWCVDKLVNAKKLSAHFKKGGVQSFTFGKDISSKHLAAFLEIAAGLSKYPTADDMKRALESRGAAGIRINYVVYRKITDDEEIIRKGAAAPPPATQADEPAAARDDQSDTSSLSQLLRDPKAAADELFFSADGTQRGSDAVAISVAELGKNLRNRENGMSSGDLMEAILALREECLRRIDGAAAGGASADPVAGELQKLTHETIVELVRAEYKSDDVSAKRLAQLLRRMLPDHRELRALLPVLKNALLSEGMPLAKYIELINELRRELEGDDVVSALATATREMGVSPDEVLQEIKKNPADAARLMILATELRRTGGDDSSLERMLTEYIEQASSRIAVSSPETARPESGRQLGALLQKIEANLLDTLKRQGLEQSVLTALGARLTERLPLLLDVTKTEWIKKTVESRPDLDITTLANVIASTVRQSHEIDTQRDALFRLFQQQGFTPEQIREVLQQAAARVADAHPQIELPKGVLSSAAIMFFLDRECKLSLRYHNPFSILIVSILRRLDGTSPRPLRPEERTPFLAALLAELKSALRDIDMIGVPSSSAETIVFVILPMTGETNTSGLIERLRRQLSEREFEAAGGGVARLIFAVSITGFDFTGMADKTAFLKAAMARHRATEKNRLADC